MQIDKSMDGDLQTEGKKVDRIMREIITTPYMKELSGLTLCILAMRLLTSAAYALGISPGEDFMAFVTKLQELNLRSMRDTTGAQA